MGCINSKNVARSCNSPFRDPSLIIRDDDVSSSVSPSSKRSSDSLTLRKPKNHHNHNHSFEPLQKIKEETEDGKTSEGSVGGRDNIQKNVNESLISHSNNKHSKRFGFSIRLGRSTEAEQVAAGWPSWLTAVAGEAIDGWLPLKSENFEKMEKIGQGTYSNVYRARDLRTGKMVALKKVRFDNFQPESVRFMAREIKILRRLDHPNIMKLEGIITSRLSCSIYLVFEYMEHDLSGLLSCPDVKFTDSQIKCYMWQLLKGIEHCHSRGVIHRDIKSSNILVNNEGVLKIADFGLANFYSCRSRQPLTSRVVTLWYRPPELLLGSTNYGTYIDMWSIGCVFAELFVDRPVLMGKTEAEQLHKILELCGTPGKEYWSKSRFPLAAMFRPQYAYESSLREKCKQLPTTAVDLLDTLLSVEPEKRATAKSALQAEYFHSRPYACDPASLPKYPPNKEIDAKLREHTRRVRSSGRSRKMHKTLQDQSRFSKVNPEDENNTCGAYLDGSRDSVDSKGSYDTVSSNVSQTTQASNGGFMWETNRPNYEEMARSHEANTRLALQRHQSLVKLDSFYSTEVFKPRDLSRDRQEQERVRQSLIQPHRADVRQHGYYIHNGVRRSRYSREF